MKRWFKGVKKLYGYLIVFIPAAVMLLMSGGRYWGKRLKIAINPSIDYKGGGWVGTAIRPLLGGSKLFGRKDMSAE